MGNPVRIGRHRKARRISIAAVPAVVGVATAFAAAHAGAAPSAVALPGHQTTTAAAAQTAGTAQLAAFDHPVSVASAGAARPAAAAAAKKHATAKYRVKSGDTLSTIAKRVYHDPGYWTELYQANRGQIRSADEIRAGQLLTVPAKTAKAPAAPKTAIPAAAAAASASAVEVQSAPAATSVSTSGESSFQACVIARESGGNSQVMNSSGHYGLYQFSESTWIAYGGSAADFGDASVAEQNQVFDNAIAAGGESNWSAYDGC